MMMEAKICKLCRHMQAERTDSSRSGWRYTCALNVKKIGAWRSEKFHQCACFAPNPEAIWDRAQALCNVVRDVGREFEYLEQLSAYPTRKRRNKEAYYQYECYGYTPMYPEEMKPVRADGFGQKESAPEGADQNKSL
ncbi:MAG: hypothetical protein Q4F18_11720 [Clostridia bacterium]|nr:hypothetical protein [Clostridia bacterium]